MVECFRQVIDLIFEGAFGKWMRKDPAWKDERDGMTIELRAGVARVTVTPPIGIPMFGFAGRGPAGGIHDDLTATALVLEGPQAELSGNGQGAGVSRLAIIACDLLFLRAEEVRAVREAIARLTDMPPDHVVIACSHTHYGPLTEPDRDEQGPQVEPYLANLVHLLAGAVAHGPRQRCALPAWLRAG